MTLLDTKHKKKSFIITLLVHVLLLLLLFYLALNITEEPKGGIAVNFGTSITGAGDVQPTETIRATPKQTVPEVTPPPPPPVAESEETPEVKDQVVTQDVEDAPVIEEQPKEKPKKEIKQTKNAVKETMAIKQVNQKVLDKPVKELEEKKPDPKPDKATADALDSFLNGPKRDGKAIGGEGDDSVAGDKGNPGGDPNATSYYGNRKGLDGDGNYRLGGRKALNKEKFVQKCNESGIVVVKIAVNQEGKVIKAIPGFKGTTNSASCLMDPARRAALATRFNSDAKAPAKQVGTIRYQFKLSE